MKADIAERLYRYRKAAGLSQEQVAEKIGVSRQAVSKWECAESSPDTENLIALAMLYDVSVDSLLFMDPVTMGASQEDAGANAQEQAPQGDGPASHDEPMPEGNYTNISFEDGIHVRDSRKGEEVHVDWDGIHVDSGSNHVHLDFAGLGKALHDWRRRCKE